MTYLATAESAYADGRYLEVAEDLSRHEREVVTLAPEQQARYGMYLGLSLMKLGDHSGAERWIRYAHGVERRTPTLAPAQRKLLDAAWRELAGSGAGVGPKAR